MPASRFFSVLVAGQKIKFVENQIMMASLCDVAAIPLATPKYHEAVKRGFMRAAQRVDLGHIIDETIQSAGVDAGSDAARDAMFAAISAVKGGPIG